MVLFRDPNFQKSFQSMNVQSLKEQRDALRETEQAALRWQISMQQAHQEVQATAQRSVKNTQKMYQNSFKSLSSAISDFVMKGKVDFRSLITTILKQILRVQKSGGARQGLGGIFGSILSSLFHTGGIVGDTAVSSRRVPFGVFSAAQRMHSGGIAGLQSNEVPTILERGEGVFTPAQMRALRPANDTDRPVNVVVNVHNAPPGTQVQQSRSTDGGLQIDVMVEEIEGRMAERIIQGDGLAQPISRKFGLQAVGQ